jgi:phosphinothricin acetyltransferase
MTTIPGTGTAVSIRPVGADDIASITRIYADAVLHGTASFEIDPPDEMTMAQRHRALADGGYPYIVAQQAGIVVGYAYAGPYRVRPAYHWSVENSIYVAPTAQRQGVGRALLVQLIAECEMRGFRQMIAVIGDSANQVPSVALHRGAGFRLVGVLDAVGFKFGRWLDSAIMQRELGAGASAEPLMPMPEATKL